MKTRPWVKIFCDLPHWLYRKCNLNWDTAEVSHIHQSKSSTHISLSFIYLILLHGEYILTFSLLFNSILCYLCLSILDKISFTNIVIRRQFISAFLPFLKIGDNFSHFHENINIIFDSRLSVLLGRNNKFCV